MASVVNDPKGRKRILSVAPDGSRKTVRLGKCDRKTAESVVRYVETLLASKINRQPIPRTTASWLADLLPDSTLKERLAGVGLIEAEKKLTVTQFMEDWLENKRAAGYAAA